MKRKHKNYLTVILSALTLATISTASTPNPTSAQALHPSRPTYQTPSPALIKIPDTPKTLQDTDTLFAGYAAQVFHPKQTASLKNLNSASKLKGQNRTLYFALKNEIAKVADGTRSSTKFSIPVSSLLERTAYSSAELGLSQSPSKEDIRYVMEQKLFDFSPRIIITALLGDCPYELYWYDRTEATVQSWPEYRFDAADGLSFAEDAEIVFQLPVNTAFAASLYETDTAKTGAAVTAAANARAIVEAARGKSDYEKLAYYCQQICRRTSYNHGAAAAGAAANNGPWQMIYVFDNDPSTNVVCEGYAKAFQYLCDETVFSNANIYCYTVNGTSYSSTGYGPHMWNVVHMGSIGNYLADITNCDSESFGINDSLFLTGYTSGSMESGYTIQIPAKTYPQGNMVYTVPQSAVRYQYSQDMFSLFTAQELTLAQGGVLSPGQVRGDEAHTHSYDTSFTWAKDLSECSFTIICRTNPAHAASGLNCNVTSQIQSAATCTGKGTALYTTLISYEGTPYSDTRQQELAIDPSNHSGGTFIQNAVAATDTKSGYTGDTFCSGCKALIQKGETIPVKSPQQAAGRPDKAGTVNLELLKAKKASAVITAGKSIRFQLTGSPEPEQVKKITYRSTKKSIAKVSKTGKITGKKAGTAVIKATVTLKNGTKKTVAMKIKVK